MQPPQALLPLAKMIVTASYRDGEPVTNLQLQKILFSLNVMHSIRFDVLLFSETFNPKRRGFSRL